MTIKFKGIDPQDVLNRGAILRTGQIETMLLNNGFQFQSQNGSHLKFYNPETKENLVIAKNSDDMGYTKDATRACIRWREFKVERFNEANKLLLEQTQSPLAEDVFDIVAEFKDPENGPLLELLSLETSDELPGLVILRLKRTPQIGSLLPAYVNKDQFDAGLKAIMEADKKFSETLKEAIDEYEFKGQLYSKDKTIALIHKAYSLIIILSPYSPFAENDSIGFINQGIELVKFNDRRYGKVVKGLIDAAQHVGTTEDGKIEWEISGQNSLTQETESVRFITTPGHRMAMLDVYDLFTADLHTFIMPNNDRRYLQKILRENWGYHLTRPEGGNCLKATHLSHEDLSFEIPVFYEQPGLQAMYDLHHHKKKPDDIGQFEQDINNLIAVGSHTRDVINIAIATAISRNNPLQTRFDKADSIIKMAGHHMTSQPSTLREGEFAHISYVDMSGQTQCTIKVLVTKNFSGENKKVSLPNDEAKDKVKLTPLESELVKMENYARLVQGRRAGPTGYTGVLGQPPNPSPSKE